HRPRSRPQFQPHVRPAPRRHVAGSQRAALRISPFLPPRKRRPIRLHLRTVALEVLGRGHRIITGTKHHPHLPVPTVPDVLAVPNNPITQVPPCPNFNNTSTANGAMPPMATLG